MHACTYYDEETTKHMGYDVITLRARFADGTELTVSMKVHQIPKDELTPTPIETFNLETGETREEMSTFPELWELQRASTAGSIFEEVKQLLFDMPHTYVDNEV